MGCDLSTPAVTQKRSRQRHGNLSPRSVPSPRSNDVKSAVSSPREKKMGNNALFETLVSGVKKIASPGNMMPTVCLIRDAFPLATSNVHLEDSTPTGIQLPIVTCSQANNCRIMCFSQINFLQSQNIKQYDTSRMIRNSLSWVAGGVTSMIKIALIGFPKNLGVSTLKIFHDLGFFAEVFNGKNSLEGYNAICLLSDFPMDDEDLIERINQFIDAGGGMLVFHIQSDPNAPLPINSLLVKYGLAFTYDLLNENSEENPPIIIPAQFAAVRDNNFVLLTAKFKAIIGQSSIDITALDDIVTLLRYYIMVTDESYMDQLNEIYEYCWDYLKKTGYSLENGLCCPDVKHGIIVVLIHELMPKLPLTVYKPIPEYEYFPGKTGDEPLGEFDVELLVQSDIWIATGLWLPAGKIGTVELHSDYPLNLQIQIGSQNTGLLAKNGALKRWPNVVSYFQLTSEVTQVATSFGGITYVTCNDVMDSVTVKMHFTNFCLYPRACCDDPSVWKSTQNAQVPWGEIETPSCVFTLPTAEIKKFNDFNELADKFGIISDKIAQFMNFHHGFPYRIVFDVETNEESLNGGYPLVFLVDDIDAILHSWDKPTHQLFTTISVMSIMSLRENCFDQTTEVALSAICAASILQELFPNFQPSDLGIEFPSLFNELWDIYSNFGKNIIPDTISIFQKPDYVLPEIPEDMWICFVRQLCDVAKTDFTKLLDRVKPIPLNITISLQGYKQYTGSGSYAAAQNSE